MATLTRDARATLQQLAETGRITPDAVVQAASDPGSPLHQYFEWDDSEAAQRYRVTQARVLLARVKIEYETNDHVVRGQYFVRDPTLPSDEQGYVTLVSMRTNPDDARALLRDEIDRVVSILARARRLADVLGLSGDLERLTAKALRLQVDLQPPAVEAKSSRKRSA